MGLAELLLILSDHEATIRKAMEHLPESLDGQRWISAAQAIGRIESAAMQLPRLCVLMQQELEAAGGPNDLKEPGR